MKNLEFQIIGTKVRGLNKKFDLESPSGRKEYFKTKAGDEIEHIKRFLDKNTFIAYFLGKKSSGKGTYSKLFTEIFGEKKVAHVSVGDLVREADDWKTFKKTEKFTRLERYYRGFVSFDSAVDAHLGRSTAKLLPTEFILALLKAHIDELQGRSIFIDGMPRDTDQVSYSLYFRDLINYRNDRDLFVLIDIPESVIEERMKYRVVCPICQTSRNTKLFITSKVEFDKKSKEFFLVCDNKSCKGAKMKGKEGDEKGLNPIRIRLDRDEDLIRTAFRLHGVPKVLLRNHAPVEKAKRYFDDYEITPEYVFETEKNGKVKINERSWTVKDDNGVESYSLLAAPVMVSMLKQMVEVLNI